MKPSIQRTFDRLTETARAISLSDGITLRCRHYAFILNKRRIMWVGKNSRKSHPINTKYGYIAGSGLHAEACAIIRSGILDHSDHTLITFRIDRNNNVAMGKPCKHCQKLISDVGFKSVFFSDASGRMQRL